MHPGVLVDESNSVVDITPVVPTRSTPNRRMM